MALAVTHPTWGLGFSDEVWWSRLAQPAMHTWAPDAQAVRLGEKARPKTDPEPKALACYGLLLRQATPPDFIPKAEAPRGMGHGERHQPVAPFFFGCTRDRDW